MSYVRIAHSLTLGIEVRAECSSCGAALFSASTPSAGGTFVVVKVRPCVCAGVGKVGELVGEGRS